jgi:hypothetical protein
MMALMTTGGSRSILSLFNRILTSQKIHKAVLTGVTKVYSL